MAIAYVQFKRRWHETVSGCLQVPISKRASAWKEIWQQPPANFALFYRTSARGLPFCLGRKDADSFTITQLKRRATMHRTAMQARLILASPKAHRFVIGLCGALICVASAHSRAAAAIYSVTDLGTLGGTASVAASVNSSGGVVGVSSLAGNAVQHAFLYSAGAMIDLGTLGGSNSSASAINSSGQVVGVSSTTGNAAVHAFLYAGGTMTDLGTLGGNSFAASINNSGQIAGTSGSHAVLYSGGTILDLGTLGGSVSQAAGVNDAGQVTGTSQTSGDAGNRAFLYSGGTMIDLGTLGGSHSYGHALNASGHVVGEAINSSGQQHAFLHNGSMIDLGTLGGSYSVALGINDIGQVVGFSARSGGGNFHGFIYSGGIMTDLNSLIAPGYEIVQASAINNSGQIAASGFVLATGEFHAFLLTPSAVVPEPASLALWTLAAVGCAASGYSRRRTAA